MQKSTEISRLISLLILLLLAVEVVSASSQPVFSEVVLDRSEIRLGETATLDVVLTVCDPHQIMLKVSSSPHTQIYADTRAFSMSNLPHPSFPFCDAHEEKFLIEPKETGQHLIRVDLWSDNQMIDAREVRLTVEPPQGQPPTGQTEEIIKFQPISVTGISFSIVSVSMVAIALVAVALARGRR